ncbi:MAG: aminotransferase class IV [Porticoccus sp.]|jgi:D-alanine transaminase|uniref:aminotransferase class IV n=1 Tax=Porticoccus sp. TaxID=2024853 RepID=UPI003298F2BE|tara:strand:+ start:52673 stop:53530 length:858 start_codon:yes stop_codon:yes gene_type:complete
MSIVYLDGAYLPMAEARISPMDRGFLFGDGIYEVLPSYDGKIVGFSLHMQRMLNGLRSIDIALDWPQHQWRTVCNTLIDKNGGGNLGLYLHVSRGADVRRFHAYPENIAPTVFAFTYAIPAAPVADKHRVKPYRVVTDRDLRWDRCHIKSTALMGNVMHFQQGFQQGADEILLFNERGELTEASACNAYIVKNGEVITPVLDSQKLPGITRHILLELLRKDGSIAVQERPVLMEEVLNADEIWLTSSSKEVVPVIEVDGKSVGSGEVGDIWLAAQRLYTAGKFNY